MISQGIGTFNKNSSEGGENSGHSLKNCFGRGEREREFVS